MNIKKMLSTAAVTLTLAGVPIMPLVPTLSASAATKTLSASFPTTYQHRWVAYGTQIGNHGKKQTVTASLRIKKNSYTETNHLYEKGQECMNMSFPVPKTTIVPAANGFLNVTSYFKFEKKLEKCGTVPYKLVYKTFKGKTYKVLQQDKGKDVVYFFQSFAQAKQSGFNAAKQLDTHYTSNY